MMNRLPLSTTVPTSYVNPVSAAQVMQSGAYQPGYYPYQGGSVQPSASTGLDIGSLIGMIVPIVMMGMMTRMMVSGNGKDGEGKEKDKIKDKANVKEKQGKAA